MTPATTTAKPFTAALLNVAMGFSSDNWPYCTPGARTVTTSIAWREAVIAPRPRFFFTRAHRRIILCYRIPTCSRSKPYAYLTGGRNEVLPEFAFRSSRRCTLCRHAPGRQTGHAGNQTGTRCEERNKMARTRHQNLQRLVADGHPDRKSV